MLISSDARLSPPSLATSDAPLPFGVDDHEAGYRPGVCNIGPEEIARRRVSAWAAGLATIVFYLGLIVIAAPDVVRFLVAIPAASAAITWLQARERFCVAFGTTGTFNFGPIGELGQVDDEAARRSDRRKVASMVLRGVAIGVAVGVAAVLVP